MLIVSCVGSLILFLKLIKEIRKSQEIAKHSEIISSRQCSTCPITHSSDISAPMLIGFFNPQIVIPTILLGKLTNSQKESLIAHEHAHLQRLDLWILLFQRIYACVVWWNPFITLLARESAVYREMICDDLAVRKIGNSKIYARSILEIAILLNQNKLDRSFSLQLGCFNSEMDRRIRRLHVSDVETPTTENTHSVKYIFSAFTLIAFLLVTQPIYTMKNYLEDFTLTMPETYRPLGVSELDRHNQFQLSRAIRNRSLAETEMALRNGAKLNIPVEEGLDALALNNREGSLDIAAALLSWSNSNSTFSPSD